MIQLIYSFWLTSALKSQAVSRKAATLSPFYCCYHGPCCLELLDCIPPSQSRSCNTVFAHKYIVTSIISRTEHVLVSLLVPQSPWSMSCHFMSFQILLILHSPKDKLSAMLWTVGSRDLLIVTFIIFVFFTCSSIYLMNRQCMLLRPSYTYKT